MKDFKLSLNLNEVNMIIKALSNLPYNQVNEIISKIHAQAQEQLSMPANGQEKTITEHN